MTYVNKQDLGFHRPVATRADRVAGAAARALGAIAGAFSRRYGERAVVLETVAAVPAMVSASMLHLKSLHRMVDDEGWVRTFMDEAENQRAHLMAFVALRRPVGVERIVIVAAQAVTWNAYVALYLCSPRTAHRLAAYMSEEAVAGYSRYLATLADGTRPNGAAPAEAIAYWNLAPDARLRDLVAAIREDEAIHRDLHHAFADALGGGRAFPERPGRSAQARK